MRLTTKFGNPAPSTQQTSHNVRDGVSGEEFTSYGAFIAFKGDDGSVILGPKWNYSSTTTYYRNQFLGENTAETRKKIAAGTYVVNRY